MKIGIVSPIFNSVRTLEIGIGNLMDGKLVFFFSHGLTSLAEARALRFPKGPEEDPRQERFRGGG